MVKERKVQLFTRIIKEKFNCLQGDWMKKKCHLYFWNTEIGAWIYIYEFLYTVMYVRGVMGVFLGFFSTRNIYHLVGVPLESIRLRFALLQSLNNTLETFYLPLVDLRPAQIYNRSTAALLSMLRGLVFYDTKINLMNRVLNATEQRKPDQAAPEITLDPLETILSKKCIDRQNLIVLMRI